RPGVGFSALSIRGMFDEMHEIAGQLALKWARQGARTRRSTGFRFNSYYREGLHPFIAAMNEVLAAAALRANRFLPSVFYRAADRQFGTTSGSCARRRARSSTPAAISPRARVGGKTS
ncbi:cytochrome P450, partial [Apiospora marii]